MTEPRSEEKNPKFLRHICPFSHENFGHVRVLWIRFFFLFHSNRSFALSYFFFFHFFIVVVVVVVVVHSLNKFFVYYLWLNVHCVCVRSCLILFFLLLLYYFVPSVMRYAFNFFHNRSIYIFGMRLIFSLLVIVIVVAVFALISILCFAQSKCIKRMKHGEWYTPHHKIHIADHRQWKR